MPSNDSSTDARLHLDATLDALGSGVAALSPAAARATIERWLDVLADHDGLNDVATALGELRATLAATPIDGMNVGAILTRLGTRTAEATEHADAAVAPKLERLGGVLTKAGRALSRERDTVLPQAGTAEEDGVVQTNSEAAGPMPQGTGTNAELGDVKTPAESGTPGTKFDPK